CPECHGTGHPWDDDLDRPGRGVCEDCDGTGLEEIRRRGAGQPPLRPGAETVRVHLVAPQPDVALWDDAAAACGVGRSEAIRDGATRWACATLGLDAELYVATGERWSAAPPE